MGCSTHSHFGNKAAGMEDIITSIVQMRKLWHLITNEKQSMRSDPDLCGSGGQILCTSKLIEWFALLTLSQGPLSCTLNSVLQGACLRMSDLQLPRGCTLVLRACAHCWPLFCHPHLCPRCGSWLCLGVKGGRAAEPGTLSGEGQQSTARGA